MSTILDIALTWYAALATLSVITYLFKPIKLFYFYEAATVGGALANTFLMTMTSLDRNTTPLMRGDLNVWVATILGVIMFAGLVRTRRWLTYYPSALLIGLAMGSVLAEFFSQVIVGNLVGIIDKFVLATREGTMLLFFNAIVIALGFATSLSYFVYTVEQKGSFGIVARIGRIFMMGALGATWAAYLMDKTESVIAGLYGILIDSWKILLV